MHFTLSILPPSMPAAHWLWQFVVWWLWNPRLSNTRHLHTSSSTLETHPHTSIPVPAAHWEGWIFGKFLLTRVWLFFKNIPSAIQCPNFIIRFHSDETLDGLWHSHFSLLIFYSLLETRLCFKKKLLEQFINSWIKATLLFGTWGIKQLAKIKSLTS